MVDVEQQVSAFIEKFSDPMQTRIRQCRARLQEAFPDAVQLVYDNYNFLVIGFGPTARPSDSIVSLACHRNGVTLCFLQDGPALTDPTGILRGNGKVVRNIPLNGPEDLDAPEVEALLDTQLAVARVPMGAGTGRQVIVRSVSKKQRPRR